MNVCTCLMLSVCRQCPFNRNKKHKGILFSFRRNCANFHIQLVVATCIQKGSWMVLGSTQSYWCWTVQVCYWDAPNISNCLSWARPPKKNRVNWSNIANLNVIGCICACDPVGLEPNHSSDGWGYSRNFSHTSMHFCTENHPNAKCKIHSVQLPWHAVGLTRTKKDQTCNDNLTSTTICCNWHAFEGLSFDVMFKEAMYNRLIHFLSMSSCPVCKHKPM